MQVVSSLTFLTHLSSVPWHLITRTHFPSEAFIPQDLTCAPSPLSAVCSLSLPAPSVLTSPHPLLPPSTLSALSLVSRQVGQRPPVGSGQPRWARALPHVLIQACISPAAAPASFDHRIIRMNSALEAVLFDPRLSVDTVYITSPWLGKRGGLTVSLTLYLISSLCFSAETPAKQPCMINDLKEFTKKLNACIRKRIQMSLSLYETFRIDKLVKGQWKSHFYSIIF